MPIIENWKLVVLQNYANFNGRAGRGEYWWFVLANIVIYVAFSILTQISGIFSILSLIYSLAVLVPSIAVLIRRLHDSDKSGWLVLISFIPLLGAIILLVFAIQEGTKGPNKYGPGIELAAPVAA